MEAHPETRKQEVAFGGSRAFARYRSERIKERARILRVQNQLLLSAQRDRRAKRFV